MQCHSAKDMALHPNPVRLQVQFLIIMRREPRSSDKRTKLPAHITLVYDFDDNNDGVEQP